MKKTTALLLALLLTVCVLPLCAIAKAGNGTKDEIPIHEVFIRNLRAPIADRPMASLNSIAVDEDANYGIFYTYWYDNTAIEQTFDDSEPFDAAHMYSQGCLIGPNDGYYFADDCVFYFNGRAELADMNYLDEHPYFAGCYYIQSTAMECLEADPLFGDVNMNGGVEVTDALLALRYALAIIDLTPAQMVYADFDFDLDYDISDALLILRLAMGL